MVFGFPESIFNTGILQQDKHKYIPLLHDPYIQIRNIQNPETRQKMHRNSQFAAYWRFPEFNVIQH